MSLSKKGAVVLLGLGALAVYKYNKMSDEQKTALKDKGKKLFDEHISPLLKSTLGMADDSSLLAQEHQPVKVNGINN